MRVPSVIAPFVVVTLAACSGGEPAAPAPSSAAPPGAAAAAPAGDDALAPLFGRWALDLSQCSGGEVLQISKARFDGPGGGCDITGFSDNGDGTFTAAMSCTGNGRTTDEKIVMRPIYAPTGEGIDLVYLNRDKLESTVLRCPVPK
jgi:hypothetical protein